MTVRHDQPKVEELKAAIRLSANRAWGARAMILSTHEARLLRLWRAGKYESNSVPHAHVVPDWFDRTLRADAVRHIVQQCGIGQLRIAGYRIEGSLDLSGLTVRSPLAFDGCLFDAAVLCIDSQLLGLALVGCEAPILWAPGIRVDSNLDLTFSLFGAPQGIAIGLDNARVGSSLRMNGVCTEGRVHCVGAIIGGQLAAASAAIGDGEGAIHADQANIGGTVFLGDSKMQGTVSFAGATIGGQLRAGGAVFSRPGEDVLVMDQATIRNSVFLNFGFEAAGGVRLQGARIDGQFSGEGGSFVNPAGRAALNLGGTEIRDDVHLDGGMIAHGMVEMSGMRVNGDVNFNGAILEAAGEDAVRLNRAVIGGVLVWEPQRVCGRISLRHTRVTSLWDKPSAWPSTATWNIDGFSYDRFYASDGTNESERLRPGVDQLSLDERCWWLANQEEYARAPYRELARVYRALGREHDADVILMEEHNVLLGSTRRSGPVTATKPQLKRRSWLYLQSKRLVVGHGYQPLRALLFAIALIALASVVIASQSRYLVATEGTRTVVAGEHCARRAPCLQPEIYAADTVIPLLDLQQRDTWRPGGGAPLWFVVFLAAIAAAGWVLATFVAIGVGALIRSG